MDARPPDRVRRGALRPRVELLPRADGRHAALRVHRAELPEAHRREGLQRPLAAGRCGLRCVRHGQDLGKFNFGRYLEAAQNGGFIIALNPTNRLTITTTRTCTDANADWVANCD